jgi:D-alanine transaminase
LRTVYLNAEFVAEDQAKVSIFDRGLLFADAIYEVYAVLDGRVVDFDHHIARQQRSLGEMQINCETPPEQWRDILERLIVDNGLLEGNIYVQISRGAADRNFLFPSGNVAPTVFAFTQQRDLIANPLVERGMRIISRPDKRWGLRDIKTVQLLYASMMKMEAKAAGVDDVWLTKDGFVTEGTSQNAHIIDRNGHLITHPLGHDILPGVTRLSLLDIVRQSGMTIEERPFTIAEAQGAAEAFVSAATMFIMPVVQINGLDIGNGLPGPETLALRQAYIARARRV